MTRPHLFRFAFGRALVAALALVLACAGAERPLPREARSNRLLLPAGLDVAVRVDLAALSGDLGAEPTRQFLLDAIRLGDAPRTAALLKRSLERATLLWFGLATSSAATSPTNVLLMRGHFADLSRGDDPSASWSPHPTGGEAIELGGEPQGYERLYRLPGHELLIWAPRSQVDAIERALRGEEREPSLRPPERGAVSIAARPSGVLARLSVAYPELAERFRGVRSIDAFAEPTAGVWRADLMLDFAAVAQASEATLVIEKLRRALGERGCAVGVLARALSVTSFERDVRVQAVLLGPEIAAVKACAFGEGCCA